MKKKKKGIGILPFLVFAVGIAILLYPTASNYYNVVHQSNAIVEYAENLAAMDNETIQRMWDEAIRYNNDLYCAQLWNDLPEDALNNYEEILRVSDNGIMGYIDIPKFSAHLPIYHGTSEPVLQKGVGHLEWSSFPTGGANTHAVLTGHTGLPSARLFTDLEKMEVGDSFVLQIVGETMLYEVEKISVVLPYEIEKLSIVDGQDICTLVTCTPYGVNSHRLLVRGRRVVDMNEDQVQGLSSMERSSRDNARLSMTEMIEVALICLGILLILLFWPWKRKKKTKTTAAAPPLPEQERHDGTA